MLVAEYQDYVRRVTDADSVAQIHEVVTEAKAEHPNDPDVEGLETTGLTLASGLICAYPRVKADQRALRFGSHASP